MFKPKILIIGVNWLGDIIMTLPAIKAACDLGSVTVITRPHLSQVYELIGLPIKCVSIKTDENFVRLFKDTKQFRMEKFDYAIAFPNSLRAAIVAKMCKPKQSVGFNTEMRSFLLSKSVNLPNNYTKYHESKLYALLTSSIGCNEPSYTFSTKNFTDFQIEAIFQKINISINDSYIVIAPGAAFGAAKRWPPEKFAELIKLISQSFPKLQIVVTAGKNEATIVNEISASCPSTNFINAAGKTNLIELAILLSKAKALIANDSGTMHLAALYSTPTIVPVGPTDMVRTGALNENFIPIISQSCDKIPCRKRVCPLKHHICMKSISANEVFDKLLAYIKN